MTGISKKFVNTIVLVRRIVFKFCEVFRNADRLCGLVVRVSGYRSRDPGLISGATRFSEK
jgi:hypothetical protein